MIVRWQSCFLFSLLILYITCFDNSRINLPALLERDMNNMEEGSPFARRLFKKISSSQSTDKNKKFTNKILVKRIVPHGAPPTSFEYDYTFRTLFKPLVRVHHSVLSDERSGSERYAGKIKPKNFDILKINKYRALLQPFVRDRYKYGGNVNVLHDIHNTIKSMDARSNRLKAYNKVIYELKDILRSPQFGRSLENKDNNLQYAFDEAGSGNKKRWIPHYPHWNYWTYKKSVHEDVCPGQQVRVGNMCIWIPPH